jgi:tripartite-type tricarboxylate transporter receptor subunit TctC
MVRTLAQAVGERNSDTIIIENRPGAGTIVGANACKSAQPDGNTICLLSNSSMLFNPHLYKSLPYDPHADFEPISLLAFVDHVVIMHRSVPANSFHELVEYSKKHPDELNYGSNGFGGDLHLQIEWLKKKTGARLTHIPYQGVAPASLALEAGQIHVMTLTPGTGALLEKVKRGEIKALLVDGDERLPSFPNVPTFQEAGLPPFRARTWLGLFAPKGTPKEIVARLSRNFAVVIKERSFHERHLLPYGFWPVGSTPAELTRQMLDTRDEATELIQISGVQPQP